MVFPLLLDKRGAGMDDAATFVGAYDDYEASIAHIYELGRRVLTSYAGNLIRLRRDSDNVESDFGYDGNGDLDTAAITSWLGGANGYIVTIYDQKGGDAITQATSGSQPLYVASIQNGHPGHRNDGTADFLAGAFTGALSQPYSYFIASKVDATAVNDNNPRYMFDGDDTTNRAALFVNTTATPDVWRMFGGASLDSPNAVDANWHVWSFLFNGASSQFWRDGTSEASGNAGAQNADGVTLGNRAVTSSISWFKGDYGALIIIDPALNDTDRQSLENLLAGRWV